jgi:DNA invertase Pin-like site-specific DNA recombinase
MPATADRASVASYAQFPAELDRDWLGRMCHLSGADLAVIRRRTDPVTQLGYATQLVTVRAIGTSQPDPSAVPEPAVAGLARVSTDGQDAQLQRDGLRAAGCGRIYKEKISTRTATADRPGLSTALGYLRAGDTLVVWKLDRLGRSVKDVLTIADDLHERGVGVRILTGKLSGTYSPAGEGKFFFTMMAALAALERDIIHERTMAGHLAARAQGRRGGRPVVMDADKLAAARARRERGQSPTEIAKALGVSRASVYRHLGAGSADEAH